MVSHQITHKIPWKITMVPARTQSGVTPPPARLQCQARLSRLFRLDQDHGNIQNIQW